MIVITTVETPWREPWTYADGGLERAMGHDIVFFESAVAMPLDDGARLQARVGGQLFEVVFVRVTETLNLFVFPWDEERAREFASRKREEERRWKEKEKRRRARWAL